MLGVALWHMCASLDFLATSHFPELRKCSLLRENVPQCFNFSASFHLSVDEFIQEILIEYPLMPGIVLRLEKKV